MRAATIVDSRIEVREHPDPEPGLGQVLVRVRAAGLNAADLHQMRGGYPAPAGVPADIPGMEFAGEVVALGPVAARFSVGDRIMGIVGGGAQAEMVVVHQREAMPVPDGVSWDEAGGLPEAYTTAHDALFTQARLGLGERACIHGAAGGVGTAAVQLAVAAGAHVIATVRSPAHRDRVTELGASVVDPADFETGGPFDVILELVGAPNMDGDLRALSMGGRITVIGIGGGAKAEINLGVLMGKRARIYGSTLRSRPLEAKADAARRVEAHVLPLFEAGRLAVPIEVSYPLEQAAEAYDRFETGGKFGKIILTMP